MIITDQWNIVTSMAIRRYYPGVAALDNKIYVTGGCGKMMSSVVCYDLDTNTWSKIANKNKIRHGHSLISLHGRLYAIGGWDVDNVQVYDPDNSTWTLLQHKLDGQVAYTGAGLIKKYYLQSA